MSFCDAPHSRAALVLTRARRKRAVEGSDGEGDGDKGDSAPSGKKPTGKGVTMGREYLQACVGCLRSAVQGASDGRCFEIEGRGHTHCFRCKNSKTCQQA